MKFDALKRVVAWRPRRRRVVRMRAPGLHNDDARTSKARTLNPLRGPLSRVAIGRFGAQFLTRLRRRREALVAWRPGRTTAIAGLSITVAGGASIAALLNPPQHDRYIAEALITTGEGSKPAILGKLVSLPSVLDAARVAVGEPSSAIADRVTVNLDEAGLTHLRVRAASSDTARRLAEAIATEALSLVYKASTEQVRPGVLSVGTFENGLQDWQTGSRFSNPPLSLRATSSGASGAKLGSAALEMTCPTESGCGASVTVRYPFRQGQTYVAQAWVRAIDAAARPALELIVLGVSSSDLTVDTARRLTAQWQEVAVTWVPQRNVDAAALDLQKSNSGPATIQVDGVFLVDPQRAGVPEGPLTLREQRKLSLIHLAPGVVLAVEDHGALAAPTARSALWGGIIGLLVGVAGILCAWAAARRGEHGPLPRDC